MLFPIKFSCRCFQFEVCKDQLKSLAFNVTDMLENTYYQPSMAVRSDPSVAGFI